MSAHQFRRLLPAFAAALAIVGIFATSARAFPTYNYVSSISKSAGSRSNAKIEVDPKGAVYVDTGGTIRGYTSGSEFPVYNPWPGGAQSFTIDPKDEFTFFFGLGSEIVKYSPVRNEKYLSFGSYGTGNGQFQSTDDVAVDSSGNIWVLDYSSKRLQEFNSSGTYIRQINTSNWGGTGEFWPYHRIAIDSKNDVWVANLSNWVEDVVNVVGFNSEGKYIGEVGKGKLEEEPYSLAIDSKDNIWVDSKVFDKEEVPSYKYLIFNSKGQEVGSMGTEKAGGTFFSPTAIGLDQNDNPWIFNNPYLEEAAVERWLAAPTAFAEIATEIKGTEVTLNGNVTPNGSETTYQFEYGPTEAYRTKVPIPAKSAGSGNTLVKVSQVATGLSIATEYHFRIVATSAAGTVSSGDGTFRTASEIHNTAPPEITTSPITQGLLASTTKGSWTGSPITYSYQWRRCNAAGAECTNITGATTITYVPVEADVGHTLVYAVTGSNAINSVTAYSSPSGKVVACCEITEYALPKGSSPNGVATQNENSVFVTNEGTSKLGKLTIETGALTEFEFPAGSTPTDVTDGNYPETNVWSTNRGTNKIRKTAYSGKTSSEYSLPAGSMPWGITRDLGSYIWFTDYGTSKIGKITSTGSITEYALPAGSQPVDIVKGPDKNMWFANLGTSTIGKITSTGAITEYKLPAGSNPYGIAAASNETLWFTDTGTNKIGKITTSGAITEYALAAGATPTGIVVGVDARPWFTESGASKIGTLDASGTVHTYALPAGSEPWGITRDEKGLLWFTNRGTSKIGKIVP